VFPYARLAAARLQHYWRASLGRNIRGTVPA